MELFFNTMKINEIIRRIRRENGMTQEAFAGEIGMSRTAYAQMEAGYNSPSYETLSRIKERFDVDANEFFPSNQNHAIQEMPYLPYNGLTTLPDITSFNLHLNEFRTKVIRETKEKEKREKVNKIFEAVDFIDDVKKVLEFKINKPLENLYKCEIERLKNKEPKKKEPYITFLTHSANTYDEYYTFLSTMNIDKLSNTDKLEQDLFEIEHIIPHIKIEDINK